jgi:pimeloyl-ACP methyl ester carboxylesterase
VSTGSQTRELHLGGDLTVSAVDAGRGRSALVLHGGGGPETVAPITAHLAETMRVLAPVHPGWNGTDRPQWLSSISDLAAVYLDLLAGEDLRDVLVVGNSIGGWLACEMAVRDTGSAVGALVLIDSVGIEVAGQPVRDVFSLSPREIVDCTFHDGERFYRDPSQMDPEQAATMQANMATLRMLAGDPYMHDPGLRERLAEVTLPALAIWGDSDGIATPDYGRTLARSLGECRFELVADAGHLPQLEQPDAVFALIDSFAQGTA